MASSLTFSHLLPLKTSPSPSCKPNPLSGSLFLRTKPTSHNKKRVSFLPRCASVTSFRPTVTDDQTEEKLLADFWREIQGCNYWEGLLDPMNPVLRNEIIRYGEFAQACYDAFDFDPFSKYCGTCKYLGSDFFEKLDVADRGYEISRSVA